MPRTLPTRAKESRQSSSAAQWTARRHVAYCPENRENKRRATPERAVSSAAVATICSPTSVRISSVQNRRYLQNTTPSGFECAAKCPHWGLRTPSWTTSGRTPPACQTFSGPPMNSRLFSHVQGGTRQAAIGTLLRDRDLKWLRRTPSWCPE
jgi:hypothetical protein